MMKMMLKERLYNLGRFLKPTKPELVIYSGSLPLSLVNANSTYILTKNVVYSIIAASSPQIIEYCFFRSCESGILGNGLKNIVSRYGYRK